MNVTDETFDIARNCRVGDLYVGVPHQLPPRIWDATRFPPDEEGGDRYVTGDHDWHACVPLLSALTWKGHQWAKVQAMAAACIREIMGASDD